jgi:hypothetical protein
VVLSDTCVCEGYIFASQQLFFGLKDASDILSVRIEMAQGSRCEGGCDSVGDERVFLSFFLTLQKKQGHVY